MIPCWVAPAISEPTGVTFWYPTSEKGPMPPDQWQRWQLCSRIGSMSL